MKMKKVLIERFENDPNGDVGRVADEDGAWEVIVDADGVPHFYVETNVERDDGTVTKGMFDLEDMLWHGMTIADLMLSTFGGKLDPEEEEEALEEWEGIMEKRVDGPREPRRLKRKPADLVDDALYPAATLAQMSDSMVRQAYAEQKLPPVEDVAEMRALLGRLRCPDRPKVAA